MKITRILAYRVELPLVETTYKWSGGKYVTVFDSTIVRVETDTGLAGHREVCPLGPVYLPAYVEGARHACVRKEFNAPAAKFVLATMGESAQGGSGNGRCGGKAEVYMDVGEAMVEELKK